MPVLSVIIPRLKTNQLKWSFSGAFEVISIPLIFQNDTEFDLYNVKIQKHVFLRLFIYVQARQSLLVRGLFPLLADPRHPVSSLCALFFLSKIVLGLRL